MDEVRQAKINRVIQEREIVQLLELQDLFPEASLMTIQRDLDILTEAGLIVRTRKGIYPVQHEEDQSVGVEVCPFQHEEDRDVETDICPVQHEESRRVGVKKKGESWIFDLFCELLAVAITWAIIIGIGVALGFFDGIFYPAMGGAVFILSFWMFSGFALHKPIKGFRLRLPLLKCKGTVSEVHMYPEKLFSREWIIFDAEDGRQMKVYIPFIHFRTEDKRKYKNLKLFAAGDAGILHYRESKKFLYFEEFVPTDSDTDD